jgi:DNA-binding HxlR family transcriptional regulator
MKRTSKEIKKRILSVLFSGEYTFSELERKINTGYRSIVANCRELESFGAVKITKLDKHTTNGRPFFKVKITEQGRNFLDKL